MGAPAPVVTAPAVARAAETNRAYQQAGGDPSQNYWTANPEIRKAAEDPSRLTSKDAGYENRADIQAWMNAQGRDSQIVKNFLADRERRGLLAKPEGSGVAGFGEAARQATAAGLSPEQLAAGGAYSQGAEALPGGSSLQKEAEQAAWMRGEQAIRAESAFGADATVPAVALGGAQGLANAPNGPVDLRQAQAQAPWAGGNQAAQGFTEGVGNIHTSDQIRGMNLSGDAALGDAKVNQLLATRPDPDATAAEAGAPPAERPEDALLNKHMRNLAGQGGLYSQGVVNGFF